MSSLVAVYHQVIKEFFDERKNRERLDAFLVKMREAKFGNALVFFLTNFDSSRDRRVIDAQRLYRRTLNSYRLRYFNLLCREDEENPVFMDIAPLAQLLAFRWLILNDFDVLFQEMAESVIAAFLSHKHKKAVEYSRNFRKRQREALMGEVAKIDKFFKA